MRRPKVGELAIARFDDAVVVCLVTGREKNEFEFLYFGADSGTRKSIAQTDSLDCSRLWAVIPTTERSPKTGRGWSLKDLTPADVIDSGSAR